MRQGDGRVGPLIIIGRENRAVEGDRVPVRGNRYCLAQAQVPNRQIAIYDVICGVDDPDPTKVFGRADIDGAVANASDAGGVRLDRPNFDGSVAIDINPKIEVPLVS